MSPYGRWDFRPPHPGFADLLGLVTLGACAFIEDHIGEWL